MTSEAEVSGTAVERRRPKGYENRLVALLALSGGIAQYERAAIYYLFPAIVSELGLQMWQVGFIGAAHALSLGTSGWILGTASDRLGRKALLVPSLLAYSTLSWVTGITSNFVQMVVARVLVGAALGPERPVSWSLIAEESTPNRRGVNFGATGFLGTAVGLAIAPIVAVNLAQAVGWRWSFFVPGVPGVIVAVALWKYLLGSPFAAGRKAADICGRPQASTGKYLDVLRFRNVWVAIILNALFAATTELLVSFGALYLTVGKGLSLAVAGGVMAALGVGACIGSLAVPAASDFVGRKPALVVTTGLAGLLLLGFLAVGDNPWALMAILFLVGLCRGSGVVAVATLTESVPSNLSATGISVSLLVSTILGTVLTPVVSGLLADSFGLAVPIGVAAISGMLGAVICLFLTETAPRAVDQRARLVRGADG